MMQLQNSKQISVLFVCLGNICRSPLAEGVFVDLIEKQGCAESFRVESCGTGSWHVGEKPHPKVLQLARDNGLNLIDKQARTLSPKDFHEFDLIVAMDRENLASIQGKAKAAGKRCFCLREYDSISGDLDVPDPYYTGDFEGVYAIVQRCCKRLLDELIA